jgi:hypothetical protein
MILIFCFELKMETETFKHEVIDIPHDIMEQVNKSLRENNFSIDEHAAYREYVQRKREMNLGKPDDIQTYIKWFKNHLENELECGNAQAQTMKNRLAELLKHVKILLFESNELFGVHEKYRESCGYERNANCYISFIIGVKDLVESELTKVTRFINESNDESKEIVCKRVLLEYLQQK